MNVRLAFGNERQAAQARLSMEWGDLVIVRGEVYQRSECQILSAGDIDGLAAISGRDEPIAELVVINASYVGEVLEQHFRRHHSSGTRSLPYAPTNHHQ